jgi:hypothetical protein
MQAAEEEVRMGASAVPEALVEEAMVVPQELQEPQIPVVEVEVESVRVLQAVQAS